MAHGRQQGSPEVVGAHDGLGAAGLFGEFALPDQAGGLFGDRTEHPPISHREFAAGQQHPEFVVAHLDRGVGGIDCGTGILTDRRDDPALAALLAQHGDRALRICLTHPLQ